MDPMPVAVPKASPDPLPELAEFLAPFAPLFRRRESRASLERYVTGLLTDLPRKTCDTMAAAVAGTSTERLQHLLTDAAWDPVALDEARVRRLVAATPAAGVLLLDDTGLPKQGRHSVGVARQYSGTLGKIGNCQVVVSAEYVADPDDRRPLHWPVSAQLYLPEAWATDPGRRQRAHVPADVRFQTKPELALALIDRARAWAVPFAVVVADAGYGDNPTFIAGLEARGLAYLCAVERTFGVRRPAEVQAAAQAPAGAEAAPRGRGRPKLPRPAPLHTAQTISAALPEDAWRTIAWREGSKDSLRKQFAAVRVHWATGNPAAGPFGRSVRHGRMRTGPEGWLLAERPLPEEAGESKWYYANLPADTPLARLAALAHARWPIEQFYEDGKGECGLDDYQGRRWDGLHRHLALAMLTYSFLVLQRAGAPSSAAGGFPPLTGGAVAAGRAPLRARLAPPGPRPLVHRHQPDRPLPSSPQLTK
jgi:SRSO17 transposase